jgi:hypothetical protein
MPDATQGQTTWIGNITVFLAGIDLQPSLHSI